MPRGGSRILVRGLGRVLSREGGSLSPKCAQNRGFSLYLVGKGGLSPQAPLDLLVMSVFLVFCDADPGFLLNDRGLGSLTLGAGFINSPIPVWVFFPEKCRIQSWDP